MVPFSSSSPDIPKGVVLWKEDNGARAKRDANGDCLPYSEDLEVHFYRIGNMLDGPDMVMDPL